MHATCHCAAITVTAPRPDGQLNECPCGVCYRYGAIWAYYLPDQITVTKQEGLGTRTYIQGDKVIEFHFCQRCNGLMYWWPVDEKKTPQMGLNTRMVVERQDLEGVEVIQDPPTPW